MTTREKILSEILDQLPFEVDSSDALTEESMLADIGLSSLHLLTLVVGLQQQLGITPDQLVESGMPTTLGDLVRLVEQCEGREPDH